MLRDWRLGARVRPLSSAAANDDLKQAIVKVPSKGERARRREAADAARETSPAEMEEDAGRAV
jgi:hypothetical protein